jgi:hypothetical protein
MPAAWAQKGASVLVYDMNGRFLYGAAAKSGSIDLVKTGVAAGVHIVKFSLDRSISDGVK